MRRFAVALAGVCLLSFIFGLRYFSKVEPLKIALNRPWATLHPGLQHTRNGDLVLSNQFDALVGLNRSGTPVPLGAASWEIKDSFKTVIFKIDREKRFSDGTPLTAQDYKRSWETSLALEPVSSNSSLADVMAWIAGYDQFRETKTLSGVQALDDDTLKIEFVRPVRLVLDFLSGNRFAAFKQTANGEFLGTGHYVIREVSTDQLELTPNVYSAETSVLSPLTVLYMPPEKSREALVRGDIDVIGYSLGAEVLIDGKVPEGVTSVAGQDAFHDVLVVNGLKGRFFEDAQMRRAMQSFVQTDLVPKSAKLKRVQELGFFEPDAQVFLPFQAGRLEEHVAQDILHKAGPSVQELKARSLKQPLKVWVTEPTAWMLDAIRAAGITLSEDSRVIAPKEIPDAYYKSFQPDLMVLSISVTNGDPDGIYHALGSHGAITSPMIQRPRVAQLLDAGRSLIDLEKLGEHYGQVSKAILEEVPFIHLGFSKTVAFLKADRVEVDGAVLLRNEGHFNLFKKKR